MSRDAAQRGTDGIEVGIHASAADTGKLISYCQEIGVRQVCLHSASIGGARTRGWPEPEEAQAVHRELAAGGVTAPAWNIGRPTPAALLGDPASAGETEALYRTLAAAGAAGVRAALFYIRLPQPADRRTAADHWGRLGEYVHRLTERAEQAGVRIATHAYYLPGTMLLWNTETLERLFEEVPSAYNAATYCQKCYMAGDEVCACAARLGARIAFAHARDLRRDANPDYWVKYEETFLGEGDLDFRRILATLRAVGYRGLICPEHLGPNPEGIDLQARAVHYLQALLATL